MSHTNKTVKDVVPSEKVNMGGHIIDQSLPSGHYNQFDPFLLIHHWIGEVPKGSHPRDVGVGPHPHRGFSPITFVFDGDVEHRDSLGNKKVVYQGGTQWMFAGRGITHSERQSADLAEQGGRVEFIQFWLNAPSQNKMEAPYYRALSYEDTPALPYENADLRLVSGQISDVQGAVDYFIPLTLIRGTMKRASKVQIPIPRNQNTLVYVLSGSISSGGHSAVTKDMVLYETDGDQIEIKSNSKSTLMILAGEPIEEKVSSYGPFVMNNQTEIMQAIRDAQMGKMGILIEEFS